MTHPELTYTVTMDARLANKVGIAAALLYNLLAWQAQTPMAQDYDPDGWFYCTSAYFSEKTSLHPNTFTKAIKALESVGLIECRRMFVKYGYKNANKSVNHFRVIQTIDDFLLTQKVRGPHTECDLNIKEENIKEESQITPNGDDFASPQNSLGSAPKEVVEDFPVGAEEQKVSVRPNKKEADPAKRCWAVAKQVLEAWGYRAPKVSSVLAGKVKTWLDAGFSPEQIIEAGSMMKENGDEYWKSATPIQMLSENGLLWYQTNRKKILLDKIPHAEMCGKLYQIDPKTGGIVKEIKL